MRLTNISVVLLLISLAAWWLIERRHRHAVHSRSRTARKVFSVNLVRAGLIIAVLVAHLNVFEWTPENKLVVTIPPTHYHETFHYYLGSQECRV